MKTIRLILSLILLTSILCGCGSLAGGNRTPYLDQKERAAIEHSILENIEFASKEYSTLATFRNDTNHDLLDVEFVSHETQNILLSVPRLDKKTECSLEVYSEELSGSSDIDIYMVYTIGDYTYYSDLKVPVKKVAPSQVDDTAEYQITLKTRDGMVELNSSEPLEFFAGNEISGLKEYRIHSIAARVPYDGAIDFDVTGTKPDNYWTNLIAKLHDEDGIVVSSDSVYLSDGTGTIYCFDVEPGKYTLTFEEYTY